MTQKAKATEVETSIESIAQKWEVDPKTVENWTEYVYQAFGQRLPKRGPFYSQEVQLLDLAGKHISKKAPLHFAETGETRRLKATEFVEKFRNFQNFQNFQPGPEHGHFAPVGEDSEDEAFAELGALVRSGESELVRIKRTIEVDEDEQIEQLAQFIEDGPNRKMRKLAERLKEGNQQQASLGRAVDTAFRRLTS